MLATRAFNVLLCALAGCSFPEPPDVSLAGSFHLVLEAGDDQSGIVGSPLAAPFVVKVLDEANEPVTDLTVIFSVTHGEGTLSSDEVRTDLLGFGRTTLTPGKGVNTIEARLPAGTEGIVFTATGGIGAPSRVVLSAGGGQSGLAGSPLAPFVFSVEDVNQNGVEGVVVDFALTEGSGSLSTTSATTDANGKVSTTLTTGVGSNTLEARVPSLAPLAVSASGVIGSAVALVKLSGDGLSAVAGSSLGEPLVVAVEDSNHNGIANVEVTFATTDNVALSSTSSFTDVTGRARTTVTLGNNTLGSVHVQATANGLGSAPVVFSATSVAGPAAKVLVLGGNDQSGPMNATLQPFQVGVRDQHDNPVTTTVSFVITEGDGSLSTGSVITDASGNASTTLTLGTTGGTNVIEASVPGAPSAVFSAMNLNGMCQDGDGLFRQVVKPATGQLVISEYFANPGGAGSDAAQEWFEVANVGTSSFDLVGLGLKGTTSVINTIGSMSCKSVAAGGFALFAHTTDPAQNGGLPEVDATFSFTLVNSSGSISVLDGTTVLDTVTWPSSPAVPDGVSRMVSPFTMTTVDNDVFQNFCNASTSLIYGTNPSNFGTPKASNVCP